MSSRPSKTPTLRFKLWKETSMELTFLILRKKPWGHLLQVQGWNSNPSLIKQSAQNHPSSKRWRCRKRIRLIKYKMSSMRFHSLLCYNWMSLLPKVRGKKPWTNWIMVRLDHQMRYSLCATKRTLLISLMLQWAQREKDRRRRMFNHSADILKVEKSEITD